MNSTHRPWLWLLPLAAAGLLACDGGTEGQRCNPFRSSDECNAGLACTTPPGCVISVCCPVSGPASDENCGPSPACALDAGSDAAADAPADAPADALGQ
jgi:hypothetical protein